METWRPFKQGGSTKHDSVWRCTIIDYMKKVKNVVVIDITNEVMKVKASQYSEQTQMSSLLWEDSLQKDTNLFKKKKISFSWTVSGFKQLTQAEGSESLVCYFFFVLRKRRKFLYIYIYTHKCIYIYNFYIHICICI